MVQTNKPRVYILRVRAQQTVLNGDRGLSLRWDSGFLPSHALLFGPVFASDEPDDGHDPANHHSNIQTRAVDGVWRLQNSAQSCSRECTWHRNSPSLTYYDPPNSGDVLYPISHWTVTNYYDWMALQ